MTRHLVATPLSVTTTLAPTYVYVALSFTTGMTHVQVIKDQLCSVLFYQGFRGLDLFSIANQSEVSDFSSNGTYK